MSATTVGGTVSRDYRPEKVMAPARGFLDLKRSAGYSPSAQIPQPRGFARVVDDREQGPGG